MRDFENWNWNVPKNLDGTYSIEAAMLAVLMDIRQEVRALQALSLR